MCTFCGKSAACFRAFRQHYRSTSTDSPGCRNRAAVLALAFTKRRGWRHDGSGQASAEPALFHDESARSVAGLVALRSVPGLRSC